MPITLLLNRILIQIEAVSNQNRLKLRQAQAVVTAGETLDYFGLKMVGFKLMDII